MVELMEWQLQLADCVGLSETMHSICTYGAIAQQHEPAAISMYALSSSSCHVKHIKKSADPPESAKLELVSTCLMSRPELQTRP